MTERLAPDLERIELLGEVVWLRAEVTELRRLLGNKSRKAESFDELLAALIRLRDLPVNCSLQEDQDAWGQALAAIAFAKSIL